MTLLKNLETGELLPDHSEAFTEIFDDPCGVRPFKDLTWERMLLPYALNMTEGDFEALALAAHQVGDVEHVIAEVETTDPAYASMVVHWDRTALEEARVNSELGHLIAVLFGRSKKWGLVSHPEGDYSILGGSTVFMDEFTRAAGGRASIKERFLGFALKEWFIPEAEKRELLALVDWSDAG